MRKGNYLFMTELGFCPGVGKVKTEDIEASNASQIINIQIINAARVSPNFSMGLGIGIDIFDDSKQIPVFFDMRPYFTQRATTGFIAFDFGYNIGIKKEKISTYGYYGNTTSSYEVKDKGGIMFNPQIGIKAYMGKGLAFSVALGYKYLEDNLKVSGFGFSGGGKSTSGFLTIRMGLGIN